MSLLDSMTENTTRPSIIEGASFRLTHDTASVMSVSSTKRYLHQRVRTEVHHDQEMSGIRRQVRHHVATADAEIRLMRRRLQKLENSKQQESAVTKYDNKKGGARRPSQPLESEDIKLDNVTSQLMPASNRAQSPSSSHSGSLESLDLDLLSDSEDENDGDNENNYTNGDAAGADERNDEQEKPEDNGETLQPSHARSIIKVSPRPTCSQSNESNNPNPNAAVAIIVKAESETAAVISNTNKANNTARRSNSLRTNTTSQLAAKKTQLPSSSLATPETRLSARSSSFTSPAAKRTSDK